MSLLGCLTQHFSADKTRMFNCVYYPHREVKPRLEGAGGGGGGHENWSSSIVAGKYIL